MDDQATLIQLNKDIAQWEQTRQEDAIRQLDQCLSDALIFRRANRTIVDKAAYMSSLNGPSPFLNRDTPNVTVTVSQDRALAIATVVTENKDGRNAYRNVRFFARHAEGWRLECWFNDDVTTLTELL